MTVHLPFDVARCNGVDIKGTPCPLRETCKRFLAPWREDWQTVTSPQWNGNQCEIRIPIDD